MEFPKDISSMDSIFKTTKEFSDLNESEYLQVKLGVKYLPLTQVIPITIAYVIIFVTGVFGNLVTCIVIRKSPDMHTATNYYLFNLAISDILLLVLGLPNELSTFWQQYPWKLGKLMCKTRAYVSEVCSYVSVLTIVAFSLERYIAICHPLRLYASGLKRPIRFIIAMWLIALAFGAPFAAYTTVNYTEYPPKSGRYSEDSAVCAMIDENMPNFPLLELSAIMFFVVPMLVMVVLYIRMGRKIKRESLEIIQGSVHGDTNQAQSRKTIIPMLSAVVIAFFICWAPFHAQRLLYVYQVSAFNDINQWLYPLTGCLYYFNTTVNPILYNVMSLKYREAFKQTLCCTSGRPPITRDDHSSVRETTIDGPRRESQVVRVRSLRSKPNMKTTPPMCMRNILHCDISPEQYQRKRGMNESPINKKSYNSMDMIGGPFTPRAKKMSLVVHASNGRPRCLVSEREGSPYASESHI